MPNYSNIVGKAVAARTRYYKKFSESGPGVGIFWLSPDRKSIYYFTKVEYRSGVAYGNFWLSKEDHFTEWDKLNENHLLSDLPKVYQDNYEALPRGRVSYDGSKGKYVVLHGNWLNTETKKLVENKYKLNSTNSIWVHDLHYDL